jgi:hypothetical protein
MRRRGDPVSGGRMNTVSAFSSVSQCDVRSASGGWKPERSASREASGQVFENHRCGRETYALRA